MPYLLLFKVGAILVLMIGAYFAWEKIVADPYRREGEAKIKPQLESALAANQQCSASIAVLEGKVNESNTEIGRLHALGQAAQDASARALKEADAKIAQDDAFISSMDSILAQPATPDANESCPATDAVLRDLAGRRVRFFSGSGSGSADGGSQGSGGGSLRIQ